LRPFRADRSPDDKSPGPLQRGAGLLYGRTTGVYGRSSGSRRESGPDASASGAADGDPVAPLQRFAEPVALTVEALSKYISALRLIRGEPNRPPSLANLRALARGPPLLARPVSSLTILRLSG